MAEKQTGLHAFLRSTRATICSNDPSSNAAMTMTFKQTTLATIFSLMGLFTLTAAATPSDVSQVNPNASEVNTAPWWKKSIIYQIYPRSFKDTNHDGIGDLKGIIAKLDYLKELGVDAIYMNPHYDSANVDYGYDVRDYRKVLKEYGTMADFQHLVNELKKRNMRLIIDAVINHTSDEHRWFKQSRSSLTNHFRDYYFWHQFSPSSLPLNEGSIFGGNPWEYDEKTNQYYIHYFTKHQPDLNWDNPEVRHKIYAMLRFWLKKGVAGIRFDSIATISKDLSILTSNQPSDIRTFSKGPHLHEYLQEMHQRVLAGYPDVVSIGEIVGVDQKDIPLFVDSHRKEIDVALNIDLVHSMPEPPPGEGPGLLHPPMGMTPPPNTTGAQAANVAMTMDSGACAINQHSFQLKLFRQKISKIDQSVGAFGWNNVFLTNHDNPRAVSIFGNDQAAYRINSAKALATLLLTLRGTPIIYQGDEIGMTNYPANFDGDSTNNQTGACGQDRRHSRSPFQWDRSAYAGFSTVKPWLGVNPSYKRINAKTDLRSHNSIYHYYQTLIEIRRQIPALMLGSYTDIDPNNENVLAYTRTFGHDTYLILINFSQKQLQYTVPADLVVDQIVIQNTGKQQQPIGQTVTLHPWQSGIYHVKAEE